MQPNAPRAYCDTVSQARIQSFQLSIDSRLRGSDGLETFQDLIFSPHVKENEETITKISSGSAWPLFVLYRRQPAVRQGETLLYGVSALMNYI
jgi:hypothetical protein